MGSCYVCGGFRENRRGKNSTFVAVTTTEDQRCSMVSVDTKTERSDPKGARHSAPSQEFHRRSDYSTPLCVQRAPTSWVKLPVLNAGCSRGPLCRHGGGYAAVNRAEVE